ncbi:uncharacterized protein LOC143509604 [Brachyhypopomus gauderio]|uniref:uncharacterized protein LOC143509604 n=1 Tax=Brachyhypopomus gauderio TaxID=698409 RepID=UPI00404385A4
MMLELRWTELLHIGATKWYEMHHLWRLFEVCEINAEFKRITTMPLQSKFLSQLDSYSDNLSRLFQKRGGQLGERLKGIVAELAHGMDEVAFEEALEGITIGIAVIKEGTSQPSQKSGIPTQPILDIVIVIEGSKVVEGLNNVALAVAMLFGLMYAVNLSYPSELRYTFQIIQKVFMELDAGRLSKRALTLKQRLLQS